jgi:4-amino-4-deoxy-L-arabinose transferase-like glycosyltransferase
LSLEAAAAPGAAGLRRLFWGAIAVTGAFRLWLAWWFPFTGDEAYFVSWARAPDWSFYDHPPMVGWLLAALLPLSQAKLVLRLPAVLLPAILAIGIAWLVRHLARGGRAPASESEAEALGYATALAWLLVPAQVLDIATTTDTPLIFFAFVSLAAFVLGVRRSSPALFAAAGAAVGLAFLAKYFAVMLGFAYLVFTLLVPRPRRWRDLAIVVAAALPFALINVAWNYEHCWTNVLFNVYNRHVDVGFAWYRPLLFAALLVYVSSPLLVWQLARGARSVRAAAADPVVAALAVCAFTPLAVFAALAFAKNIGLHWLLSFMPALFMTAALALGARRLLASAKFLAGFSALHVVALVALAALPLEALQRLRQYDAIVLTARTDELLAALKPYEGRFAFAADSYSPAVTLAYHAAALGFTAQPDAAAWRRHYFFVFGRAAVHGRHDDILTDFRHLDGKDILVVRRGQADPRSYASYFRSVEVRDLTLEGASFRLVLGEGFDYPAYRDQILAEIRKKYYRIPSYLPQGRCYLCERYFGTRTCPAR